MALRTETSNSIAQDNLRHVSAAGLWSPSAPAPIRRAHRAGDREQEWSAWQQHLAARRRPQPLDALLPGGRAPLAWAIPPRLSATKTAELLERLGGLRRQRGSPAKQEGNLEDEVAAWLSAAEAAVANPAYGLEALAWCHALPRLAAVLAPDLWWRLLAHLIAAAGEAQQLQVQVEPLTTQLLAGELPLALAYVLPELAACRDLAQTGRHSLSYGLVEVLDAEGLPNAAHLDDFRSLLACWTRSQAMGAAFDRGSWDESGEAQFRGAVASALRLARRDGDPVFSTRPNVERDPDMFEAAVRLAGGRAIERMAAALLPGRGKPKGSSLKRLPAPAVHSEVSKLTLMRTDWKRSAPRLSIAYAERQVVTELAVGRDTLWSGAWDLEVRVDGDLRRLESDWEEVCWVTDDDVDYLELEAKLAGGWRVERSMLLARKGTLLVIADAIFGTQPAAIEYVGVLPLAAGIEFSPTKENREGRLSGRKRRATVLPLALAEWRTERGRGELARTERGLELRQKDQGACLFAPLFIDLDANRPSHELTWRQLVVAENRQAQPRDVAVGYRAQIGNRQWLMYRSLGRRGSRSVLGQNLSSEFLVARFRRSGKAETLLEIE